MKWFACVTVLAAGAVASGGVPCFQGLGDLPGSMEKSEALAVSGDGQAVVGYSYSASGYEAFRWTEATDMVGLGDLPGGGYQSRATGVSGDGSSVVGVSSSDSGNQAFLWTQTSDMVGLGDLSGGTFYSWAFGVSDDGAVAVGVSRSTLGYEAFRWMEATGMVGLDDLSGGAFASDGYGVSADGSVVVGRSSSGSGTEAFRWTQAGGMVGLDDLPGGMVASQAEDVSPDGAVIVGLGDSLASAAIPDYFEAFRWTQASGMVGLGDLPGGEFHSHARGVSADGGVVVGQSLSGSGMEAFLWDAVHGMRPLRDVLVNDFGLDLTGWQLADAAGVSDDGTVIVGVGTNPAGKTEAWRAVVPEPAALALLLAGGLLLSRRGRARCCC